MKAGMSFKGALWLYTALFSISLLGMQSAAVERRISPREKGGDPTLRGFKEPEYLIGSDYVNRTANLRLRGLEGWRLAPELRRKWQAAGALETDEGALSLLIFRAPFGGTLQDSRMAFQGQYPEPGFKLTSETRLKLDGQTAVQLLFKGHGQGRVPRIMATMMAKDGILTLIMVLGDEPNFDSKRSKLEVMVDSCRRLTRVVEPGESLSNEEDVPVTAAKEKKIREGTLIHQVPPTSPKDVKRGGIGGTVLLRVAIDSLGNVTAMRWEKGPAELVGAAMEAVRQWAYAPWSIDGEPVPVLATVTVNFASEDR